jgi:hypothetical protein
MATVWGRAVELSFARYQKAMSDASNPAAQLDSSVEILLWSVAIRQLWRVAHAAKALKLPAVQVAIRAFQAEVNVADMTDLRDIFEHADDYARGLGRKPLRGISVDINGWTAAARKLRDDLRQATGPRPSRSPSGSA